jgi:CDP-glucose 4,6-dehydratase
MSATDIFNDTYRGRRVVVTGDTGFKGSWLAIWLLELGAEVYGYALPPRSEQENFHECRLAQHIHHTDGDVRDLAALREFFRSARPEFAFHLAAQPLVLKSYRDPIETFSTNVMGTANFLECVREQASLRAAVVVTTDKVYENHGLGVPFKESDRLGGKDPYSASKACAELVTSSYISSFASEGMCHVATARAGNVIGGRDWCEYRLVPDIFRSVLQEQKVIIRNPQSVRPWQHVLEPLAGYLLIAATLAADTRATGAWNFSPLAVNHVTVEVLTKKVLAALGKGEYEVVQAPSDHEAKVLILDSARSQEVLGWRPILSLDETVRFTVDGYSGDATSALAMCTQQITAYIDFLQARLPSWGTV